MVIHTGRNIPTLLDGWDSSDKDWVWVVWDSVLDGATITASTWTLPNGWTEHSTKQSQSVTDENSTSYTSANGVLTSNPEALTGSLSVFANKVVLSDGREYERSVSVVVVQQ